MSDPIETLLRAIAHHRAGRHEDAEALLHAVLAAEPDQPNALFLLGQCALAQHRTGEAVACLSRALALRPAHRDGRVALARAQLAAGLPDEALETLAPLAGERMLAAAQTLRGTALNALGRPADAVAAFRQAIAANPLDAETHLNLGNAHADLAEADRAEHHVRHAIALQPGLAEAHASLGHLLAGMGRVAEAVACNAAAIALSPDLAAAHWNQGVALLLSGDMKAGWEKYEWRKRRFPASFGSAPGPQWEGGPLNGRTILVLAEQGLGDTIQFARYLPMLARRGARVVVECATSLIPLLAAMPGVERACAHGRRPAYDVWVDQMSLPRLFGTTLDTVPCPGAYLRADATRVAEWDSILPAGLRVGLAWAGNPLHSNDARRSMSVPDLAPILATGRGSLVSLQVGGRSQDVGDMPGVTDLSPRLTDWRETAAAVEAMDLVITVDTAVAHLAGALGIPTWVMLPHAPDWRWMLERSDTPWYSCMRLFRQERPSDWAGVAARIAAALEGVVRPDYSMAMPPLTCSVAPVTHAASSDAR